MSGSSRRRPNADLPSSSDGASTSSNTTLCTTTTSTSAETSNGCENKKDSMRSRMPAAQCTSPRNSSPSSSTLTLGTAAISPSRALKNRKRKGILRREGITVRCIRNCICAALGGFGFLLVCLLLHANWDAEISALKSNNTDKRLDRRRDASLEQDRLRRNHQKSIKVDDEQEDAEFDNEGDMDLDASGEDNDLDQEHHHVADPVVTTKFQTTWKNMGLGATNGLDPPQPLPCTPITDLTTIEFTLVTQLSEDRVWMLEHHCKRWGYQNSISIAVYTTDSAETVTSRLVNELHCNPAQLVSVQTLSPSLFAEWEYPVNILRNMALMAVKTSHVLYVDVDFWESINLHSTLMQNSIRKELARDPKLTIVIPAFQIARQCREYKDCREKNIAIMPNTYAEMKDMFATKAANKFDHVNSNGHGSTMYDVWFARDGIEDLYEIPCVKSNRYEPYMTFRYCDMLPPFQEQFTGYGKNKMTWVMQMRRVGYSFVQIGEEFLVHYPHLESKARLEWKKQPDALALKAAKKKALRRRKKKKKKTISFETVPDNSEEEIDWTAFKRGQVDALYVEFRKWLSQDVKDESRVSVCEYAHDDDVQLWVKRDE